MVASVLPQTSWAAGRASRRPQKVAVGANAIDRLAAAVDGDLPREQRRLATRPTTRHTLRLVVRWAFPMSFDEIRKRTIIALFSDDQLTDQLVLKGGNALRLIHRVSPRTSLDLDFSLQTDFPDFEESRQRIFRVLKDRFDSSGYVVFDESLEPKPRIRGTDIRPWWGGYELKFKIIQREKYERLARRPDKLQMDSLPIGPGQKRVFSVQISKNEYTDGKQEFELDDYRIYVYSLEMLLLEKLRALCQQMKEYEFSSHPTARARDFYDIHLVLTRTGTDLSTEENADLLRQIFAAKKVPVRLLELLPRYRDFHRQDWAAVVNTVPDDLPDYNFHFDFVVQQVGRLKALWMEDPPL